MNYIDLPMQEDKYKETTKFPKRTRVEPKLECQNSGYGI